MGVFKIIATILMVLFAVNIIRKLIMGETKVAAWKKGEITNEDGARLRLNSSRSLRFSLGFLVIAMAAFFFSE